MTAVSREANVRVTNPTSLGITPARTEDHSITSVIGEHPQWEMDLRHHVCDISFQMLEKVKRTVKQMTFASAIDRHSTDVETDNLETHTQEARAGITFEKPRVLENLFTSGKLDLELTNLVNWMRYDQNACKGRFTITLISPTETVIKEWQLSMPCKMHQREDASADFKGPSRSYALDGNLSPKSSQLFSEIHDDLEATRDVIRRLSGATSSELLSSRASSLSSSPSAAVLSPSPSDDLSSPQSPLTAQSTASDSEAQTAGTSRRRSSAADQAEADRRRSQRMTESMKARVQANTKPTEG